MRTYQEIKDFLLNFNENTAKESEKQEILKEIAVQLGFKFNDCGCKSLTVELYTKLSNWLRHHTALSHYRMEHGVLLFTKDGQMCSATNITDEMAEELLQTEKGKKYIRQILPIGEESEKVVTTEEIQQLKADVKAKQKAKSGKRTIKDRK